MIYFAIWYLVISILGFISLPLIQILLPGLKDRGYAFSRILGLMIAGFLFWLLTSYQILQNDVAGILAAFGMLLLIGLLITKKNPVATIKEILLSQKWYFITIEILFLVSFIFLALLRASSPDITGTEKPMELAFINAILRSTSFPPNDPWLAGYSISYYYFGYVITAMLIKVTTTPSGIGFNLMISLVFALTAIGMYGLVYNIINSDSLQGWIRKHNNNQNKSFGLAGVLLPLFGPLFTLVISNFEGLLEFMHARGLFWKVGLDGQLQSGFWKWLDIQELVQAPALPFGWWPNRPAGIIWWRASRVLSDYNLNGNWLEIIDEFPFFSFLLADLHPHVLALPFATLLLAVGLSILMNSENNGLSFLGFEVKIKPINLIFYMVFLGGMAFLNTWDLPVYLVIVLACYLLRGLIDSGFNWHLVWNMISLGILLIIGSVILYLPFYIGFASQAGGIIPSVVFSTRGIHFWIMFGTLLLPIFAYVLYLVRKQKLGKSWVTGILWSLGVLVVLWIGGFGLGWLALNANKLLGGTLGYKLSEAGGYFLSIQGGENQLFNVAMARRFSAPGTWLTLLILGSLVASILVSLIGRKNTEDLVKTNSDKIPGGIQFSLLLILAGIFLTLIPEFVYLRDQFGWRMNTIFKFYYQAWILWSLAASLGIAILWLSLSKLSGYLFSILITIVVICGMAYPIIGIAYTTNNFNPVNKLDINGTSYLERYNPDESQAIQWLADAPFGYVIEAVGGSYSSFARVATISGLPGVIGWPPHESQWRGGAVEIGTRETDVETFYSTPDWQEAKSILDTYKVKYIYIGGLERTKYRLEEEKFLQNLTPVFQNQTVTIYSYDGMHK